MDEIHMNKRPMHKRKILNDKKQQVYWPNSPIRRERKLRITDEMPNTSGFSPFSNGNNVKIRPPTKTSPYMNNSWLVSITCEWKTI